MTENGMKTSEELNSNERSIFQNLQDYQEVLEGKIRAMKVYFFFKYSIQETGKRILKSQRKNKEQKGTKYCKMERKQ